MRLFDFFIVQALLLRSKIGYSFSRNWNILICFKNIKNNNNVRKNYIGFICNMTDNILLDIGYLIFKRILNTFNQALEHHQVLKYNKVINNTK